MTLRWFLCPLLCCGLTSAFPNADHQTAWNALLSLDARLSAGVDTSCVNDEFKDEVNRVPSIIFGLQITQFVRLGLKTYSLFPQGGLELFHSPAFDKSRPTVIMVHGRLHSSPHLLTGIAMKAAYDRHGPHNVLAIGYGDELAPARTRVELTRLIGESLALDLRDLAESGYDVGNVRLVGHDIGAHVVGFAGKAFKVLTDGTQLPFITALDPSAKCFENDEGALARGDAAYVEVVHTAVGVDMPKPVGNVDYYLVEASMNLTHSMVWKYYAEAVQNPGLFTGVQCGSLAKFLAGLCSSSNHPTSPLEYARNERVTGTFFMRIGSRPPYGLGARGLQP